jgi:electron transfer flavoprotein beta subunit
MTVAVCLKWVDQRPELGSDGLLAGSDDRFAGISLADQAALELALRSGEQVVAITVGPIAAERALRDAAACGAHRLIRIDSPTHLASPTVARLIAGVIDDARVVWCGDYSLDRGTGSVPAFLAAELGVAQLLGLIAVSDDGQTISATRRLDGGRRELLRTSSRAVCSVEGSTAPLRRAGLSALLAARTAAVEVVASSVHVETLASTSSPYRPRARAFAPPTGNTALDRVRSLVMPGGAGGGSASGESVALEPAAAAAKILQALVEWGYLAE